MSPAGPITVFTLAVRIGCAPVAAAFYATTPTAP